LKSKAEEMERRGKKLMVEATDDGEDVAVYMTERMRAEEKERMDAEKQSIKDEIRASKEALKSHKRIQRRKQEEADKCDAEKQQAMLELIPIFDAAEVPTLDPHF
jgi:hypothetical protein